MTAKKKLAKEPTARVYAAHPKACYGSEYAARCLAGLAAALPDGAHLIDPETCQWADDEEWLAAWPALLARLAGLVVFAEEDGSIGIGCVRELSDATAMSVPVAGYSLQDGLCEIASIELGATSSRSAANVGRLVLAGPVSQEWRDRVLDMGTVLDFHDEES